MTDPTFTLTERAAARIAAIAAAEPATPALRLEILSGGCNGLQYKFGLVPKPAPDDLVISDNGAVVCIDPVSMGFLAGAQLDYKDALMGAHFVVVNPNADSACGCGNSFSAA